MSRVECVVRAGDELGEGPIWCDRERALYWTDIRRPALQRFDPATGEARIWPMPDMLGSFVVRERGDLLLALRSGLRGFDPATGAMEDLGHPEAGVAGTRYNDGKCDRRGRFWVGTMTDPERMPRGTLYRVDPDFTWHRALNGVVVPNSLAWSPDDTVMYFADTAEGRIRAYAFDADAGRARPARWPSPARLRVDRTGPRSTRRAASGTRATAAAAWRASRRPAGWIGSSNCRLPRSPRARLVDPGGGRCSSRRPPSASPRRPARASRWPGVSSPSTPAWAACPSHASPASVMAARDFVATRRSSKPAPTSSSTASRTSCRASTTSRRGSSGASGHD